MCGNSTVNNLKPHVMKKKEEKECLRQQLGSLEEEVSSVQASSLGLWWKAQVKRLKEQVGVRAAEPAGSVSSRRPAEKGLRES